VVVTGPERATVPALLAHAARSYGGGDFVVDPATRLSFGEAERRSRNLALALIDAGIGKGSRVGILVPTQGDFVVAWLAAARIGALSVLYPTTSRGAELRRDLCAADVQLLLVVADLVGREIGDVLESAIPELSTQPRDSIRVMEAPYLRAVWRLGGGAKSHGWLTDVDTDADMDAGDADRTGRASVILDALEAQVRPSDELSVVLTSGSSARPKAIVHSHGNAVRQTGPGARLWPDLKAPERHFCAMPLFWIGGFQMMLSALHHGGTVVCQPRFDANEASHMILTERCSAVSGWIADRIPGIEGVERLSTSSRWGLPFMSSRGDPRHIGMTETLGPHYNADFFEYRIVDPDSGVEMGSGIEGEFCVRGPGMMLGMYGLEREQVFDADGFYHTGDRAYLEDGHVYFTGRYTRVIKSSGVNVSAEEVESALMSLDDVSVACVFAVGTDGDDVRVGAVVVPVDDRATIETLELAERLRERMSPYKIPHVAAVARFDELPLLSSGKVDKRGLEGAFAARLISIRSTREVRGDDQ
jgi:acyl-CoA synthetase (AMP-forming)/AMP-acid ligase II